MRPQKRSAVIEIPVTFDSVSKPGGLTNDKFLISLLVFGVWLFTAVVSLFTDLEIINKIIYIVVSFCSILLAIRFLIMKEYYFKKKRSELLEKDYKYPYSMFWNIYEVTNSYPHICRYANGLKSIFVVFEKDVIVGREEDNDFYHYEAISEAYLQMSKRGIDCMHIDYMDSVGKDNRVATLFDIAKRAENPILGEVLTRVFDNVEDIMQRSYASYDVYCFFYNGKDELFADELEVVINSFLDANYLRYKVLDKEGIGELVKSVFNIDKFSVNYASEKLFSDLGGTHYLKPIWVERGYERKILNKTREELEEERKTKEAEKDLRKSKRKQTGSEGRLTKKYNENRVIDLFGSDDDIEDDLYSDENADFETESSYEEVNNVEENNLDNEDYQDEEIELL